MVQALNSSIHQISFHDPEGHVFEVEGRLLRRVSVGAANRLIKFLNSRLATDLIEEKLIPSTRVLSSEDLADIGNGIDNVNYVWFEHERIEFISYAYEWVPEMLLAAAELTLMLVKRLNAEGWDLKDASANNVVFAGVRPVFIDLCSIIEQNNEPYWRPKGQFERHFILPLIAYIDRGVPPHHIHISNADGLDPVSITGLLGLKRWASRLGIKHCALPALLSKTKQSNRPQDLTRIDPIACAAAKKWQLRSIESSLTAIKRKLPKPTSAWHTYTSDREHYSTNSLVNKKEIVESWIKAASPRTVLDLGANTGEFSILASKTATRVLAFEKDLDAARLAYLNLKNTRSNCQIILQDLGNPSPAIGWNYQEKKSINQRISGAVDCVLALALMHHWLVTAGIPLEEILSKLAQWTSDIAIIEFIPPEDTMFALISAQRNVDFSWLDLDIFRHHLKSYFSLIQETQIKDSHRTLFLCKRLK